MTELHNTILGRRFFEATLPKIATELARLNQNLEALVKALRAFPAPPAADEREQWLRGPK